MCPDSAYLYTLHSFNCGEAVPLVWAFLPNKPYEELFRAVYDCLMASYGSIGSRYTFLVVVVDFETAAIKAINHVFTDAVVKGCSFHFRQAVYR